MVEWEEVTKVIGVSPAIDQVSFEQYIQILIGFRMLKQYNQDHSSEGKPSKQHPEIVQSKLITDLFEDILAFALEFEPHKLRSNEPTIPMKLFKNTLMKLIVGSILGQNSSISSNSISTKNVKHGDDQSTAADMEESKASKAQKDLKA